MQSLRRACCNPCQAVKLLHSGDPWCSRFGTTWRSRLVIPHHCSCAVVSLKKLFRAVRVKQREEGASQSVSEFSSKGFASSGPGLLPRLASPSAVLHLRPRAKSQERRSVNNQHFQSLRGQIRVLSPQALEAMCSADFLGSRRRQLPEESEQQFL